MPVILRSGYVAKLLLDFHRTETLPHSPGLELGAVVTSDSDLNGQAVPGGNGPYQADHIVLSDAVLQHPAQDGPRLDVDHRQQIGHPAAPVNPNILDIDLHMLEG